MLHQGDRYVGDTQPFGAKYHPGASTVPDRASPGILVVPQESASFGWLAGVRGADRFPHRTRDLDWVAGVDGVGCCGIRILWATGLSGHPCVGGVVIAKRFHGKGLLPASGAGLRAVRVLAALGGVVFGFDLRARFHPFGAVGAADRGGGLLSGER